MDKYEYKLKMEQIEKLVKKKDFITAAKIADDIDWGRNKDAETLNRIADIYEEAERLDECMVILNILYEQSRLRRGVVYRMAEVAVGMNDLEGAKKYYEEFVALAPKNSGKYLLEYYIGRAEGQPTELLVDVLEKFKSEEYDEQWAYKLACLYEEAGNVEQCIETCDELALWFGEGVYVTKALELKMKYRELTATQKEKYDCRFEVQQKEEKEREAEEANVIAEADVPETLEEPENLIAPEKADGTEETAGDEKEGEPTSLALSEEPAKVPEVLTESIAVTVSDMDENPFSTINIQEQLAESLRELLEEEEPLEKVPEEEEPMVEEPVAGSLDVVITQEFIPVKDSVWNLQAKEEMAPEIVIPEETAKETTETPKEEISITEVPEIAFQTAETEEKKMEAPASEEEELQNELSKYIKIPQSQGMDRYLGIDEDGQIRLLVENEEGGTKQITGQLTIEEILEAWEEKKRKQKLLEEELMNSSVLCETGEITGLLGDFIPTTPKQESVEAVAEEVIEPIISEEISEEVPELVDDLPIEIENSIEFFGEEPVEEEPAQEPVEKPFVENQMENLIEEEPAAEGFAEEEPVKEKAVEEELITEESVEAMIGQNTASMLDAIERALAQEITPYETAGTYLTEEQEKIFAYFTSVKGMKKQLLKILNKEKCLKERGGSNASNLVITGHPGNGKTTLAIDIVKVLQKQRGVKGGKIAKVTGEGMNKKSPEDVLQKIGAGALIIERAGGMNGNTVEKLMIMMEGYIADVMVILEDATDEIFRIFAEHPAFADKFQYRVDIPIFSNDELVAFGKSYAEEQEFYFEEMAVLALYDCIGVRQTAEHVVNVEEVKDIVDQVVASAEKRGRKLWARLSRKRVDEDGNRLILEEDFKYLTK